jgi:transcriptional regulator with XRE-family HTH domain
MEQEMKISSAVVRRLRTEHGWSQDRLAQASGLSLRTIQRVEADGTASMETTVSLAATFGVQLTGLLEEAGKEKAIPDTRSQHGSLLAGMVVFTCALIGESGRLPDLPTSEGLVVINALLGIVGVLLSIPPAIRLIARRHYAAVALATLGAPLVTLSVAGLLVAISRAHTPTWQLGVFGIGGAVLMVMAIRQFRHPIKPAYCAAMHNHL